MAKQDAAAVALAETLRNLVGCDDLKDRSRALEFWARPAQQAIKPAAIHTADDYDGAPYLTINLSRLNLSPRQQRQQLERWCQLLPTYTALEWLWITGNVSPVLFEVLCALPKLRALCISQSTITSLTAISQCQQLQYLKLGCSPDIDSIEPLSGLYSLKWLQLDQLKQIHSLTPLQSLTQLEGLGFTGADHKSHLIETLSPLQYLTQLRWLHLGALRVQDASLQSIGQLKQLQWLGIPNAFTVEEFASLSNHLASEVCDWLQPYLRLHSTVLPCRICKQNWRVMAAGQGSKTFCPSCDALKLARHMLTFNQAKAAAAMVG